MKTKKGFTLRPLGKEYILVAEGLEAVDFTRMISMNATAAFLWQEVEDREFDSETLINLLMDQFGITHEVAEKDVAALLLSWKEADIVDY